LKFTALSALFQHLLLEQRTATSTSMKSFILQLPLDTIRCCLAPFLELSNIMRLDIAAGNHNFSVVVHEYVKERIGLRSDPPLPISYESAAWLQSKRCYPISIVVFGEAFELPFMAKASAIRFQGFSDGESLRNALLVCDKTEDVTFTECSSQAVQYALMSLPMVMPSTVLSLSCDDCSAFTATYFRDLISVLTAAHTVRFLVADSFTKATATFLAGTASGQLQHLWIESGKYVWNDIKRAALSEGSPALQVLHLSGCEGVTEYTAIKIATNCTGLRELTLRDSCTLTGAAFNTITDLCHNLTVLHLAGIDYLDEDRNLSDAAFYSLCL
jgi:hypothetical protein